MQKNVRVRFAPSPTGPLHIGGVRTALYNYLFAKKNNGTFILRIEDTDQKRYVAQAEDYIQNSLEWLQIAASEGPKNGGEFGPYRQSERKSMYEKYALELVDKGFAYYAFDTPDELQKMRTDQEALGNPGAKYDQKTRMSMKNSFTLSDAETEAMLASSNNTVIRLNIPDREISFTDIIRENVSFQGKDLDDKVILKNDGMPTYHLANIVDDHNMEISHVIRGEEWLSSTAHHVLMYEMFGWESPQFAHLPLILKPTGKGKLSKRDGAKFGFPVFPLSWEGDEPFEGFKEFGFNQEALINFLALLGWSSGDDNEIFSLDDLISQFSLERINKSGARFDIEKAKWFNQQYIIKEDNAQILAKLKTIHPDFAFTDYTESYLLEVISLLKERVHLYPEILQQASYFFKTPEEFDEKMLRKKFKFENEDHLKTIFGSLNELQSWDIEGIEGSIKNYITDNELSFGAILPIFRIAVTGKMQGPDIMASMFLLGKEKVIQRLESGLELAKKLKSDA